MRASHEIVGRRRRNGELAEFDDFDSADEIDCVVDYQSVLCVGNCDCAISHHAIGIALGRISIESGRQIDGKNKRMFFAAQSIDFLRRRPNRLAQQMFGAETKKAVEDNQVGRTCFRMSDKWDERKLVAPKTLELLARQLSELSF